MAVRFDANLANALVNGMPVPIDAVYSFCQDAYDSFNKLNETMRTLGEKEREITRLLSENEMLKNILLEKEGSV